MRKILMSMILVVMVLSVKAKEGVASYYHDSLHGNLTANGEIYKTNKISCAHKTLPFGTILKITNKRNGKVVIARVNDRGPFIKGRDVDLSRKAAEQIGMVQRGVIKIEYEIVDDLIYLFQGQEYIIKI